MNFSLEEEIDMIYCLGEGERNSLLASRIYAQRYPERRHPRPVAFENLKQRFERTGHVQYEKNLRRKNVLNEENEFLVLASIVEDPHASTRALSRQLEMSQTSVSRIIRKHKFHPYHIQLVQELNDHDFENRLHFCDWALNTVQHQPNFFDFVMFSDEATFHKNGFVNRHNFHYYDTHNPHFIRQLDHQHRWSINVCGGIVGTHLIGPYFFEGNVNGESYLQFLRGAFQNYIEDLPLNIVGRMWLQQDGAPPHYSRAVREYLDEQFPGRWIGRGGPIPWPARSPDLTKLDFFLWGYVKEIVYQEAATTKENMKIRIQNAFRNIGQQVLRNVGRSFVNRIRLCHYENGRHIEHLL